MYRPRFLQGQAGVFLFTITQKNVESEQEKQEQMNLMENTVLALKQIISAQLDRTGIYKTSTCDAPNWDVMKHHAMRKIQNTEQDWEVFCLVIHGVSDWVVTRK